MSSDWATLWDDLRQICDEYAWLFYAILAMVTINLMITSGRTPMAVGKTVITCFSWSSFGIYSCNTFQSVSRVLARDFEKTFLIISSAVRGQNISPNVDYKTERNERFHMLVTQFVFTSAIYLLVTGLHSILQCSRLSMEFNHYLLNIHKGATVILVSVFAVKTFLLIGLAPIIRATMTSFNKIGR